MKTLKKSLIALAAAGLFSSVAQAEAVTVYGKLNVTLQASEEAGESTSEVKSNASRLGVKGDLDLGNNLQAIYTIEYEVKTDSGEFKARNQFVGLKGGFGQVTVGRQDTMLKISQGKVDLFNDLEGDIKNLLKGENRMGQTAAYLSPKIADVATLGLTYVAKADNGDTLEDGVSAAAMFGDKNLKKSAFYAALAMDSKVKGYDAIRATGHVKLGDAKLGALVQKQTKIASDTEQMAYLVSGSYSITKAVALKTQYQLTTEDNKDDKKSLSVGADYKLGSATKAFAFYTMGDRTHEVDTVDVSFEDKWFGLGLEHKF
ncbi:porin [Paraferrimonas sp. SM1919]|uniref:porin n=1 Tax=Paraferrimonas sp. SM1919 TaxID=2662263 RepID=UPI0013D8C384|nr:porin [Paraferrimonas sp. SM1919]